MAIADAIQDDVCQHDLTPEEKQSQADIASIVED